MSLISVAAVIVLIILRRNGVNDVDWFMLAALLGLGVIDVLNEIARAIKAGGSG
jgi:hypothetical protein